MVRGRDYVIPDDVKSLFLSCCAHRVVSKTYLHNGDADGTKSACRRYWIALRYRIS